MIAKNFILKRGIVIDHESVHKQIGDQKCKNVRKQVKVGAQWLLYVCRLKD